MTVSSFTASGEFLVLTESYEKVKMPEPVYSAWNTGILRDWLKNDLEGKGFEYKRHEYLYLLADGRTTMFSGDLPSGSWVLRAI